MKCQHQAKVMNRTKQSKKYETCWKIDVGVWLPFQEGSGEGCGNINIITTAQWIPPIATNYIQLLTSTHSTRPQNSAFIHTSSHTNWRYLLLFLSFETFLLFLFFSIRITVHFYIRGWCEYQFMLIGRGRKEKLLINSICVKYLYSMWHSSWAFLI